MNPLRRLVSAYAERNGALKAKLDRTRLALWRESQARTAAEGALEQCRRDLAEVMFDRDLLTAAIEDLHRDFQAAEAKLRHPSGGE